MSVLRIEVAFDFICPWCYIGKRNLETALAALGCHLPQQAVEVHWQGLQLLPGLPAGGMPFGDFYRQRLGSEHAVKVRQAEVTAAAADAGLGLKLRNISVMPNTSHVHRLFQRAQQVAVPAQVESLLEKLFEAYFIQGRDIGDTDTLLSIAEACGFDANALAGCFEPSPFRSAVAVNGVPNYTINRSMQLSGALPAENILAVLCKALEEVPA